MKKKLLFAIVAMVSVQSALIFASASTASIFNHSACSPEKPMLGQTLRFQFPENTLKPEAGDLPVLLLSYDLFSDPDTVAMTLENQFWQASLALADSEIQVILFAVASRLSGNNLIPYDVIPLYQAKDQPVENACFTMAMFYSGVGDKFETDPDLAREAIDAEIRFYPENYHARYYSYTMILKESNYSQQARGYVQSDIERLLKQNKQNMDLLEFASSAYQLIGKTKESDQLLDQMAALQPDGYFAYQKKLSRILEEDDLEARLDSLNHLIEGVRDTGLEEFVLTEIISTSIALADTSDLVQHGDQLLIKARSAGAANALAALAGVLSENKKELNRAEAFLEKAIVLMDPNQMTAAPPSLTTQQWQRKLLNVQARYQDLMGWIQYQKGDAKAALLYLEPAASELLQPSVFYHLAVVYQHLNRPQDALVYYARTVAFEGALAEAAREALIELWANVYTSSDGVERLITEQAHWVDTQYQEKTYQNRQIRPAPNFDGEDLSGDRIVLADQKGNVVLLCFWASWSKGSAMALDVLRELTGDYGDKVLFLTVAMDQNASDVRKMIDKQDLDLNVMLNSDIDRLYDLQGVPTLFLIDAAGNIHFEHRGYRPDLTEVLTLELDDLLRRARKNQLYE